MQTMTAIQRILPGTLRPLLEVLPPGQLAALEELRLRAGFPLAGVTRGEEWQHPAWRDRPLTEEDLRRVVERAGEGSVHAVLEQVRQGYLSLPGGLRLGLCGEGVMEGGKVITFRRLTSLALRLPHRISGLAPPLLPRLTRGGRLESTLLLSPPGLGKTTLLRDLIRCLSQGEGVSPHRVGVADERGELGGGDLRLFLGPRTDVMEGLPKSLALLSLLRSMGPQVLAMDEVTDPQDLQALTEAAGCGVALLATAHGESVADLRRRPLYTRLLEGGIFRCFVVVSLAGGQRQYTVFREGEP
jgi:stage III sporulation protein AA